MPTITCPSISPPIKPNLSFPVLSHPNILTSGGFGQKEHDDHPQGRQLGQPRRDLGGRGAEHGVERQDREAGRPGAGREVPLVVRVFSGDPGEKTESEMGEGWGERKGGSTTRKTRSTRKTVEESMFRF